MNVTRPAVPEMLLPMFLLEPSDSAQIVFDLDEVRKLSPGPQIAPTPAAESCQANSAIHPGGSLLSSGVDS